MTATVKVSQGWLEGELLDLVTGDGKYYSFKGIPYAAPPIGALRFKAPQPPVPWKGIKGAKSHGPNCPQHNASGVMIGNEDCLYLNVYTRYMDSKQFLPVMVFFHAGGFVSGSGDVAMYGPDFLINHGVVLVTLNYRLGPLGFLCLETEDVPGNAGLKDQNMALRWVKENIVHFGGDPNNVTIFGQSSGGVSVILHLLSPMSRGLFKKAISMSGVPLCDWVLPFKAKMRSFIIGKLTGLETDDPKVLLDFLQTVPAEKLFDANPIVIGSERITKDIAKMFHFVPVQENYFGQEQFVTGPPIDSIRNGRINEAHLFIGHTNRETVGAVHKLKNRIIPVYNRYEESVVPRELLMQCNAITNLKFAKIIRHHYFGNKFITGENIKEFIKYCDESSYLCAIYRMLKHWKRVGSSRVFVYKFCCMSERNYYGNQGKPFGIIGAAHMDDCMYLFDAKDFNLKIDRGSREYQLVQLSTKVFTNFAKYGTPTPDSSLGVVCPEYDWSTKQLLKIGDQLSVETQSDECYNFWKTIFYGAGLEF